MYNDPIVAEVRKTREKIMKEFGYDLQKYCNFLREKYETTSKKTPKRKAVVN